MLQFCIFAHFQGSSGFWRDSIGICESDGKKCRSGRDFDAGSHLPPCVLGGRNFPEAFDSVPVLPSRVLTRLYGKRSAWTVSRNPVRITSGRSKQDDSGPHAIPNKNAGHEHHAIGESDMHNTSKRSLWAVPALCLIATIQASAAPAEDKKPEFRPFSEVSKGYTKVVSTADGKSFYNVWKRNKDGQMLAELPSGYANQKHYIAMTAPTGELFAGLQWGDFYVQWKRFDKRLALIVPNLSTRSTGDQASKDAIKNHALDRVLVDVPIACMGPSGQPVIDLDELLLGKASVFYGSRGRGLKRPLAKIAKAKSFPENLEIAYAVPASNGEIRTFHYSISRIKGSPSYKTRTSDLRVGYFQTDFRDLGKMRDDQTTTRLINRWHLEKADPKLAMSPPKEPITYYLEHTVPVRYRRWVKAGALYWNKAFEEIGISDAVVIHYQDKATGAHMEKDPEDVRYNFIRWLANDFGTAIGPSRAHPETGQILDADVILTDGWIRHFWWQYNEYLPDTEAETAMQGMTPETLQWLESHPDWDPRIRLAPPHKRAQVQAELTRKSLMGETAYDLVAGDASVLIQDDVGRLAERFGSAAMLCMASHGKARAMEAAGVFLNLAPENDDDDDGDEAEDVPEIDGVPEWFLGPMLADLVAHEVGHTLGLRHNFKASSIYTFEQMNSEEWKGKKPMAGSVMDYLPANIKFDEDGKLMGDIAMIEVGPYDMWAIEYGYSFGDTKKILERVAEPELAYLTDDDTSGPDPFARRYDLAADPMTWCENQMSLANKVRGQVLGKFVKDGDSWAKARRGFDIAFSIHRGTLYTMTNWLGGTYVVRDHKGDPGDRTPLEAVSADKQRAALEYVVTNTFFDEVFGLDSELLAHMTDEKWEDQWTRRSTSTYRIHDRVSAAQASVLTSLMNPTKLERIYDQELFVPATEDTLTLPEVLETISSSIWEEVGYGGARSGSSRIREAGFKKRTFNARVPMISSLRRNLQREHLERLIDLALEDSTRPSMRSIALLARMTMSGIQESISEFLTQELDVYTRAHLLDAQTRITKALDASYTYGGNGGGSAGPIVIHFGREGEGESEDK